jgi:hypothetical protein
MVDKKVSETVGAQPLGKGVDVSIVFARMTDEKYRHCPSVRKTIQGILNVLANRKPTSLRAAGVAPAARAGKHMSACAAAGRRAGGFPVFAL